LVHGLLKVCPNQLLVLFLAFRGLACKSRLNVYICGSSKLFIVVYERGNSSKLRALWGSLFKLWESLRYTLYAELYQGWYLQQLSSLLHRASSPCRYGWSRRAL